MYSPGWFFVRQPGRVHSTLSSKANTFRRTKQETPTNDPFVQEIEGYNYYQPHKPLHSILL
jgi:hypothetical protein